jgi:hypothetical protein
MKLLEEKDKAIGVRRRHGHKVIMVGEYRPGLEIPTVGRG